MKLKSKDFILEKILEFNAYLEGHLVDSNTYNDFCKDIKMTMCIEIKEGRLSEQDSLILENKLIKFN